MVLRYNFNVKWCWHVCYFLLVSHTYILPCTEGSQISLLVPLPTFTETIYEAEIPDDQQLNATILTVKARDRDAKPDPFFQDDFRYILIDETTDDHYQAIFPKKISLPTNDTIESWVYSHWSRDYRIIEGRYLAIRSDTGSVHLRKPLNIISVGRITARVLIVDFRDPIVKEIVTLVINVKAIPQPSNVAVDSVTDTSARVCWRWSSSAPVDGFIVELEALTDGSHQIYNLAATNGSDDGIICTCVELTPGSDHKLWVYGRRNGVAGLSSDKLLFHAKELEKLVCDAGLHQPRIYHKAPAGTHVTTVQAHDRTGSKPITYSLATASDTFSINETSGQLLTTGRIDKNVGDSYGVSVQVKSGTELQLCPLQVRVSPLNTASLRFPRIVALANIPYYQPPETTILAVKAYHDKSDPYNNKIRYLIRETFITEYGQDQNRYTTNDDIPPLINETDVWLADELVILYDDSNTNKYLAVDERSGAIYLKQRLVKRVDRIYAQVLAVDSGSPSRYNAMFVHIHVRNIGPPLNVTVSNITETSTRVCWRQPSYGHAEGFTVQVQALKDGPVRNHTVRVAPVLSSEGPLCTYVGLERTIHQRLWVYGYSKHVVGWSSDHVLINIRDREIHVDHHPCPTNG